MFFQDWIASKEISHAIGILHFVSYFFLILCYGIWQGTDFHDWLGPNFHDWLMVGSYMDPTNQNNLKSIELDIFQIFFECCGAK